MTMVGCHREKSASESAEKYYGYLVKGDVDRFLKGVAYFDSLPETYRSQMQDMYIDYLDRENRLRSGLLSAKALRDTMINENMARVFMEVCYADSTREEIMVQMVQTDKGWRLF